MKKFFVAALAGGISATLFNQEQQAVCPGAKQAEYGDSIEDYESFLTPWMDATGPNQDEVNPLFLDSNVRDQACKSFLTGARKDFSSAQVDRVVFVPDFIGIEFGDCKNEDCTKKIFMIQYCCPATNPTEPPPKPQDPTKRLYRLQRQIDQVLVDFFDNKWSGFSDRIRAQVDKRIKTMEKDYYKKIARGCTFDQERTIEDDRYTEDNPCLAAHQLTKSFIRWSSRFNVNCEDRPNKYHDRVKIQFAQIKERLQNRFKCEEN